MSSALCIELSGGGLTGVSRAVGRSRPPPWRRRGRQIDRQQLPTVGTVGVEKQRQVLDRRAGRIIDHEIFIRLRRWTAARARALLWLVAAARLLLGKLA